MNRRLRKTLQLAKWFAVFVFALVITVIAAIQVDQRLMRRDAEALLSDLRKLEVGVTTNAEAQQVLHRWPEATRLQGNCQSSCWIGITLNDFPRKHNDFFIRHRHFLRLYIMLGGQLAEVRAAVEFVDNAFQVDTVGVYLYVAPYCGANNTWPEYTLIGGAGISRESPRLGPPLQTRDKLHPTYLVGPHGGCDGCMLIDVRFMPDVTSYDRNRLMQFDFSCLTRWMHPCRTQGDIMPAAWQQFMEDQTHK
jgi:hypothetical protein